MSKPDGGGPAFPLPAHDEEFGPGYTKMHHSTERGMTLRQYYAAKAMHAGIIARPQDVFPHSGAIDIAFQWADAMIEAEKLT